MASERVQRQIDRLLDEAERAVGDGDWALGQTLSRRVLTLESENSDAQAMLGAAERGLTTATGSTDSSSLPVGGGEGPPELSTPDEDDSAIPGTGSVAARFIAPGPGPSSTPQGTPAGSAGASPAVVPTSFAAGRYAVKRFLGEGGKKRVYLAHDTLLDRDVAFALIKTEGLDAVGRDRIRREAQAMGRLGSHPQIVSVFDLGEEPPPPSDVGAGLGACLRSV